MTKKNLNSHNIGSSRPTLINVVAKSLSLLNFCRAHSVFFACGIPCIKACCRRECMLSEPAHPTHELIRKTPIAGANTAFTSKK